MVYLIDGDDVVASRNKLNELVVQSKENTRIDGKKQTLQEISDELSLNSLFGAKRTIIIEDFLKVKPQAKLLEALNGFIENDMTDIVLWDAQEFKGKVEKGVKRFSFKFPKLIYSLLDGFAPSNMPFSLKLLKELEGSVSGEQIFFMLSKRLRQILFAKANNFKSSDFKGLAEWQISRIKKQAGLWGDEELMRLIFKIADIDEKMKTSTSPLPISKHLDILLLTSLN